MAYHISEITAIVKGEIAAPGHDAEISELIIDSRKVIFPASSLFFAIKGGRRDGHAFVDEAYRKGIRNFIVSDLPLQEFPGANIIRVPDVLIAMQTLAAHHRSRFNIPVVGITGSNGKTIVKEWLNQLLAEDFKITRSPRSYNSQVGVPLSVWQMSAGSELCLFEAGISQPGEMERLQRVIRPTIGIFTNIGDAHAEGFLDEKQKIREKLRLFTSVDVLIFCLDYAGINDGVNNLLRQTKAGSADPFEIFSWSRVSDARLRVSAINKDRGATEIFAEYKGEKITITIPFTDEASIENAIHCWCVLLHLGTTHQEIARRMAQLHPVAMRLELKNGSNNTSIINDSYSADLSSLKIALDFLSQQHQHTRKSVILTDFLESGMKEKELYESIARSLREHGIDRFIGIGPVISRNRDAFRGTGADAGGARSEFFSSVEEFALQFRRMQFENETILLKGARVFELEQVDAMLEKQTHQTVLEINLDAVLHNLRTYQRLLKPSTRIMAMVKAFSYGSGSYEIASVLQFNKVDYLAVAYTDEGVALRKGGITLPIMVMNPEEASFAALIDHNLEPEIYSPALLWNFASYLEKEGLSQFPVHIELETGMNRLGFAEGELDALLAGLKDKTFKVQTVFSHLVASEDPAHDSFTARQADLFTAMSGRIIAALGYPVIRHLLNTSGVSRHPSFQFDMVRLGIGLYGIDRALTDLREVSTLRSSIAQVKTLHPGETVGYGRSGTVQREARIATVRIGYADGYPRALGNGIGKMLVRGKEAPTVGNICMDMTMIDVSGIPGAGEGDEVIIFGNGLPVADVAARAGTIAYEILTGVSQRVKRVYFHE